MKRTFLWMATMFLALSLFACSNNSFNDKVSESENETALTITEEDTENDYDILKKISVFYEEQGISAELRTSPLQFDDMEPNSSNLFVYCTSEYFAFAIDDSGPNIVLLILDIENQTAESFITSISGKLLRGTRVVGDSLLLSTTNGFYQVDLQGNIIGLYIYQDNQDKYMLPECSSEYFATENIPIISDDASKLAYFELNVDKSEAQNDNNQWSLILLDISSGNKRTLDSQEWNSSTEESLEGVLGKYPISFINADSSLIFEYVQLQGMYFTNFGGIIDIADNGMVEQKELGMYHISNVDRKGNIILLEYAPPSMETKNVGVYNYTDNQIESFDLIEYSEIVNMKNNLNFSMEYIVNIETGKYALFPKPDTISDHSSFSEINERGQLVGIFYDDEYGYIFATMHLE